MLRVLIERPPTVDEDVGRSKADYLAIAKRYPDIAGRMRVEFCGTQRSAVPGLDLLAHGLERRHPRLAVPTVGIVRVICRRFVGHADKVRLDLLTDRLERCVRVDDVGRPGTN